MNHGEFFFYPLFTVADCGVGYLQVSVSYSRLSGHSPVTTITVCSKAEWRRSSIHNLSVSFPKVRSI